MPLNAETITNKQQDESVIRALREATATIHQRLHQHPITTHLTKPSLQLKHYQLFLQAFECFHEVVENQIASLPSLYSPVSRSLLLKNDLNSLNITSRIPIRPELCLDNSEDDFLGLMYVVEGASLGGQVMAKNVYQTLGFTASHGASFLNGKAEQTSFDWKHFLIMLEQHASDSEQCTKAALASFTSLENWLWQIYKHTTK